MPDLSDRAFERFAGEQKKALRRIAGHTRGEHQLADVVNEAWLMARTLQSYDGRALDLDTNADRALLLSHLYQHLVRYTELNVRHAVRLDHAPGGSDDEVHPLAHMLASQGGRDPLGELVDLEDERDQQAQLDEHGSQASAYVRLLRHFDNRMPAVAEHLLISTSYAYRRCAHARVQATVLAHIPVPMEGHRFVPGPWRSFQLRRRQVQLPLDFGEESALI